jgi:hypothetical protein
MQIENFFLNSFYLNYMGGIKTKTISRYCPFKLVSVEMAKFASNLLC